jgi:hypothetical protein
MKRSVVGRCSRTGPALENEVAGKFGLEILRISADLDAAARGWVTIRY